MAWGCVLTRSQGGVSKEAAQPSAEVFSQDVLQLQE